MAIKVGIASELEQYRADTYASKEPETLDWLDENLRDQDVFMDVGANIGLYSLYAAKVKPACIVYAFEPESQNYASLCRNVMINGLSNIVPCNFSISDREGFDLFYVGEMRPGSALHSLGERSIFAEKANDVAVRQGAMSVSLDALVVKYGLPLPAALKIDVDGSEDRILAGARAVLSSHVLRTVLVEVSYRDEASVRRTEDDFGRLGYKLTKASTWVWERNGLRSQNYIFVR